MAPVSGQPEFRRLCKDTLHLVRGPESSDAAQLLTCRNHPCQSPSRITITLKLRVRPCPWLSTAVTRRCVSFNVLLQQAGRARRSHPEDVGHVTTKGSEGRTTPAVAASDRRKSLKLVRGSDRKRRGKCICLVAHWSLSPPGLSPRVGPLHPVSVSSPQLLGTGCPEDPCQAVEQQLHRGRKHVSVFLSELERSSVSDNQTSASEQTVNRSFRRLATVSASFFRVCQEFPAVSALELLVRANITVKSTIKHLVLKDAAAQVSATPPPPHTHTRIDENFSFQNGPLVSIRFQS